MIYATAAYISAYLLVCLLCLVFLPPELIMPVLITFQTAVVVVCIIWLVLDTLCHKSGRK